MRKRLLWIIALLLVLLIGAGGAYYVYKKRHAYPVLTPEQQAALEEKEFKEASALLEQKKAGEALEIIKRQRIALDKDNPGQKKWLDLAVDAAVQQNDIADLALIYNFRPELIQNNEEASLLVATYFVIRRDNSGFQQLRKKWAGKETKSAKWFFLDVDALQNVGERDKALALLNSKQFEGTDEELRLLRLAQIFLAEKPQEAWKILNQANRKDPNNPIVHFYRARLLEASGKPALGMQEYIETVRLAPNNSLWRDQLAEFFLRQRQYAQALQIWKESLTVPYADTMWIKLIFLDHVLLPVEVPSLTQKDIDGSKKNQVGEDVLPLISYLRDLPQDRFWDSDAYESVKNGYAYLQTQQITFWMRLLQALKDGRENDAWTLLEYSPFSQQSWKPELERALQRILIFRKKGTLLLDDSQNPKVVTPLAPNAVLPPLFNELENLAKQEKEQGKDFEMPAITKAILLDPNVFAIALLNVDWMQGALTLQKNSKIPDNYPEWVAYGFTQAVRYVKGIPAAQEFAAQQTQSTSLKQLEAELWIASNEQQKALDILLPLAKAQDEEGERAAHLAALILMEQKKYGEAKALVNSQSKLASGVAGKEILARVAFLEGNKEEAIKIYSTIEADSSEAKSFLARQAFDQKDWKKAKALTEELLRAYPNNPTIRANYKEILKQEAPTPPVSSPPQQVKVEPSQPVQEPVTNGTRTP